MNIQYGYTAHQMKMKNAYTRTVIKFIKKKQTDCESNHRFFLNLSNLNHQNTTPLLHMCSICSSKVNPNSIQFDRFN